MPGGRVWKEKLASDEEVRTIMVQAYEKARSILSERLEKLKRIASLLIEKEIIEGDELKMLLKIAPAA